METWRQTYIEGQAYVPPEERSSLELNVKSTENELRHKDASSRRRKTSFRSPGERISEGLGWVRLR